MQNDVHIELLPVSFTLKNWGTPEGKLKAQIISMNLKSSMDSVYHRLTYSIPVFFRNPIHIRLSINRSTLSVKIDYSLIRSSKQKRLIKSYLEGDMKDFAQYWLTLTQ